MTSRTHDNFRHNFWTWVDPPPRLNNVQKNCTFLTGRLPLFPMISVQQAYFPHFFLKYNNVCEHVYSSADIQLNILLQLHRIAMPTSKSFASLNIIIFYVYHHKYSHWLCLQANKQIGEPTNKGAATNRYQIPTSFATSKANVRVVSSCFRCKYENIFILFSTHPACVQLRHFAIKGKIFSIFCTNF